MKLTECCNALPLEDSGDGDTGRCSRCKENAMLEEVEE